VLDASRMGASVFDGSIGRWRGGEGCAALSGMGGEGKTWDLAWDERAFDALMDDLE